MNNQEQYVPTPLEKELTLAHGDFLKISGDGIFATRQGEGVTAGEPVVFLRLQDCNLHCGANDIGWRCDTWYTWDKSTPEYWQESSNQSVPDIAGTISDEWNKAYEGKNIEQKRLVVSGGEPLLQQDKLLELFGKLPEFTFEIETNGTIMPRDELAIAQINCSPKLSTSGNELRARYRPKVLEKIASLPNSWFKFVVSNEETDIPEIQKLIQDVDIDNSRVILMSEGNTTEELESSDPRLEEIAATLGYSVTRRNHIFWFGNKRRT